MLFTANDLIYDTAQHFGEIIEDRSLPYGLANALQQTRKKGLQAASMPKLIQAKTACADFTDPLWADWFSGMSGVYHIGNAFFFSHGNDHPLANHTRIRRAIQRKDLIDGAARLTPVESRYFTQRPVLAYEDFLQQSARQTLLEPYTIRADASLFRGLKNKELQLRTWRNDPRAIIYAGGKNAAEQYAERLRQYGQIRAYLGLDTLEDLPDWGRMLFLGGGNDGLGGGILNYYGRFVGVAPEAHRPKNIRSSSLETKIV